MRETVLLKFNGLEYSVWKKEFEKIKPCNLETITEYDKENKREGLTEKTRGNSIQIMLILAKQFQKPFKDITREDLNNYIDELTTSNGTKRQYVLQIRKFLDGCIIERIQTASKT